jgi:hypothetical protein
MQKCEKRSHLLCALCQPHLIPSPVISLRCCQRQFCLGPTASATWRDEENWAGCWLGRTAHREESSDWRSWCRDTLDYAEWRKQGRWAWSVGKRISSRAVGDR